MSKLKTHKATAKKVKITKGKGGKKKFILKTSGQDHFNARESGNTGRNKRRHQVVHKVDTQNVRRQLPYS